MIRRKLLPVLISTVLIAIGGTGNLMAQEWARKMFSETSHDFGSVAKGLMPQHVFEIENCYEEEMVIEYVRSSCGCTKVEIDKRILKTWEKAKLTATFDTVGFNGKREATLTVGFGRPYRGEVKLAIQGTILSDVQVYPAKIDFGTVAPGNLPKMTVTVTRRNNAAFVLSDVRSTFPHIGVTISETQRNGAGVSYQVQAWLKDDVPAGFVQGELNAIALDRVNGKQQEIRIPVQFTGKVTSPLEVSPPVLTFSGLSAGEKVSKKIVLKADQPFQLLDVTCENSAFSVQADNTQRKSVHFIEIVFDAPADVSNCEAELKFVTDLVAQPSITLPAIVSVAGNEASDR